MKSAKFLGIVLVLCLLVVSTAYSKKPQPPPPAEPDQYIHYHGYAILDDNCTIQSDGQGQYVDRELTRGNWKTKRGDKIEVTLKYDPDKLTYNLAWFRCFIGKPELYWRSPRRVKFNVDMSSATQGAHYNDNITVADMLRYTVTGGERSLADGSVHMAVSKGWYPEYPDISWVAFLVDKSCEGEELDPDAITQTNLWSLDETAPRYWTSLEGSSFGSEVDPHSHIGFFIFEDELTFKPTVHEYIDYAGIGTVSIPITWEVTSPAGSVNVYVSKINPNNWTGKEYFPNDIIEIKPSFDEIDQHIWTLPSLAFRLTVSRDPLENLAPSKSDTISSKWGEMKIR